MTYQDIILYCGISVLCIGIIFLIVGKIDSSKKVKHQLENEVTDLFYKQHEKLYFLQGTLFDQKQVEDALFYNKRKFLTSDWSDESLNTMIQKGNEDIVFLEGLNKPIHTK